MMSERRIRNFVVVRSPITQLGSSNEARWIRFPGCVDKEGNPVSVTISDPRVAFEMALSLLGFHSMVTEKDPKNGG